MVNIPDTDLQPLFDLASQLEASGTDIAGIPSELQSIVDPALLQSLGELQLSEDMGVVQAAEDATSVLLGGDEQIRRLGNRFTRQQELTGANLSGRGIAIRQGTNEGGLVAQVAQSLGERQGEQYGDLQASIGTDLRNILRELGNTQLGNVADLGGTVGGAVSGAAGNVADTGGIGYGGGGGGGGGGGSAAPAVDYTFSAGELSGNQMSQPSADTSYLYQSGNPSTSDTQTVDDERRRRGSAGGNIRMM